MDENPAVVVVKFVSASDKAPLRYVLDRFLASQDVNPLLEMGDEVTVTIKKTGTTPEPNLFFEEET